MAVLEDLYLIIGYGRSHQSILYFIAEIYLYDFAANCWMFRYHSLRLLARPSLGFRHGKIGQEACTSKLISQRLHSSMNRRFYMYDSTLIQTACEAEP